MSYLQFIAAFIVLVGAALLWGNIIRGSIGEGMVLAVCSVVCVMFLTGYLHAFSIGIGLLTAAGIAGWIWQAAGSLRHRGTGHRVRTPYLFFSLLLVCLYLVLYNKDFIQHIDEFHLWAPAVRYMLRNNALPIGEASYDARQLLGTSYFHVFFQHFTGFNEAFLYTSATLLTFLGLLLPFGSMDLSGTREEKLTVLKKVALYIILMVLAVYTLYLYGLKNLYVDMPCAAWAGGLAVWWTTRKKKKKSNLLVLLAGSILVYVFKSQVGTLMVLCLVVWVVFWSFFGEGSYENLGAEKQKRFWKIVAAVICLIILATVAIVVLPPSRRLVIAYLKSHISSMQTVKQMLVRFITAIFGKQLSSRGNLPISFMSAMALIIGLFWAGAHLAGKNMQKILTIGYSLLITAGYLLVLIYAYSFIFSAEESVKVAGIARYLSIPIIYMFILAVSFLMKSWDASATSAVSAKAKALLIGLTIFFAMGMDESFIPSMTGIDKPHIVGYEDIHGSKEQIKTIKKIIGEEDRVYLLNQIGKTEYPVNAASYELEEQVNNYIREPWCFTETGCKIRVRETEDITLKDFPQLLEDGGYTYLWIYTTDEYLTENLPEFFDMEEEPADGQLYRLLRDMGGKVVGLEMVRVLL